VDESANSVFGTGRMFDLVLALFNGGLVGGTADWLSFPAWTPVALVIGMAAGFLLLAALCDIGVFWACWFLALGRMPKKLAAERKKAK